MYFLSSKNTLGNRSSFLPNWASFEKSSIKELYTLKNYKYNLEKLSSISFRDKLVATRLKIPYQKQVRPTSSSPLPPSPPSQHPKHSPILGATLKSKPVTSKSSTTKAQPNKNFYALKFHFKKMMVPFQRKILIE